MRGRMLWTLGTGLGMSLGCGGGPTEPAHDDPANEAASPGRAAPGVWVPPDPESVRRVEGGTSGVDLLVRFTGIGAGYQGYLAESERLTTLSADLAPCLSGGVELVLSYDASTSDGRMVLVVPRDRLRCAATSTGEGLDITPLTPITEALAAYREVLGSTRDIRLLSWKAGLLVDGTGTRAVTLWLGGEPPEDGSEVDPCVTVDTTVHCPTDEAAPEGTTVILGDVDPAVRRRAARYLGASG